MTVRLFNNYNMKHTIYFIYVQYVIIMLFGKYNKKASVTIQ